MRSVKSSDGLEIRVGENAEENDALCKQAGQNDIWFHLENGASPHVILEVGGKKMAYKDIRDSIHECTQLVKYFSKNREMQNVSVMYTEMKFVSKQGASNKTGSVTLKKSPLKTNVTTDESGVTELLSRMKSK